MTSISAKMAEISGVAAGEGKGTSAVTTSASNEQTSVFDNMSSWLQSHENNTTVAISAYDNFAKSGYSNEEIENAAATIEELYEENKYEIGNVFDFVNNEAISDVNYESSQEDEVDEETYEEALQELGEGEVASRDGNNDGVISWNEYLISELKDLDFSNTTEEELLEVITDASVLFDVIDEKMGDQDGSGTLDASDFASYYENLDRYEGSLDDFANGTADGKIEIDQSTEAVNTLIESFKTDERTAEIKELYGEAASNIIAMYTTEE